MCKMFLVVSLSSAVLASQSALAAPSFSELVAAYENPELGQSSEVTDAQIHHANFTLVLQSGRAAPVIAAGKKAGLFFVGQGRMIYRSVDPLERTPLLFNTRKGTDLRPRENGNGVSIEMAFERLLLWAPEELLPEVQTGGAEALQAAFAKHREFFDRARLRPASHLLVKQRLDAPAKPVVRAEISGPKEDLVYVYDPIDSRSETLICLRRKTPFVFRGPPKSKWPLTLSSQPVGRDRKKFLPPLYILSDVTFTLTATRKGDAKLSVVETIIPQAQSQRVFRFNLYSYLYPASSRARTVSVRAVTDESGGPLPFHHRNHDLVVALAQPAPSNQPLKIHFEIEADFLIRPHGDNYWALRPGPWLPLPDHSGSYFTMHATVKVEQPFIPLVPGTTLARREEDGYNVVETTIDKPIQYVAILAGKYSVHEETFEGLTIRVASYAGKNVRANEKLTNLAHKLIRYYEQWLGPFPFSEFNIIEINEVGWGQAPPGTMFITREAFSPQLERVWTGGINHRFAHEIAHQYWGHVVKMGSREDQWISEAFAEYSSALAIRRMMGKSKYNGMIQGWKRNARLASDTSSIALANRIATTTGESSVDRSSLIYDKGAYLLYCLHRELGDDLFASFMRSAQGVFSWRFVTTLDLAELLLQLTQKDYLPFFEDYYWGSAMPEIEN